MACYVFVLSWSVDSLYTRFKIEVDLRFLYYVFIVCYFYLRVLHRADDLVNQYKLKGKSYRTGGILATIGDDFRFVDAAEWDSQFENYEKLISFINERPNYGVQVGLFFPRDLIQHCSTCLLGTWVF